MSFNFMAAVTICSDFGAQENNVTVSNVSPSICHKVIGLDAVIFIFGMLSFSQLFHSPLSAIKVVSSAYLRLLIFLPANLIPACASSSLAFLMTFSAYKLNKEGDNIQC